MGFTALKGLGLSGAEDSGLSKLAIQDAGLGRGVPRVSVLARFLV